jgi:hypothetical protein
MNNLNFSRIIVDGTGKVEYRIYSHRQLTNAELDEVILKKTLERQLVGDKVISGFTYQVVKIIAGDGWEDAE